MGSRGTGTCPSLDPIVPSWRTLVEDRGGDEQTNQRWDAKLVLPPTAASRMRPSWQRGRG